MGQDRKRGAGKKKHNHHERRVWIFQRQACSLVRFGAFDGTGGLLIRGLCDFSFVLNRIVHLPVPSENLSRRGKNISEIFSADHRGDRADGTKRGTLQRKIKKMESDQKIG